ncbi:DUF58 domain-containing protein [Domibacillus robiginosus]|uniref:DUF58 domain-containing protein n=1 Tax=Domibacillus robiginosus TaxID=1071054 RepID=UPI00067E586C|nr:DUF58 domain-containing protein [Domibacillus robiginosus]
MSKAFSKTKEFRRFLLLIALTVLAFSYAMFQGGFVSWFLFYSFLPAAFYAFILFFYPLSLKGKRTFSKQEFLFDEQVRIQITLLRKNRFPLFYIVAEEMIENSPLLSEQQRKRALVPGFKKEFTFDYEISRMPRGEHHFTGIRVKTGDLFGFIEKEKQIPIENKIVVYPSFEELQYRPLSGSAAYGSAARARRGYQNEDMSMSVGIRSYQPGDRLSLINWKATAKRNSLMTKEFEQHQSHNIMIVMDCTPSAQFETVVSFTASAIKGIIPSGAQVGLLTADDDRRHFGVRGGEKHEQQLFYHLATIKETSTVSFASILENEAAIIQQSSTLLLVTSQLTEGALERARYYSSQGQSVIVFLADGSQATSESRPAQQWGGISVCIVRKGQFAKAFSEVSSA